MRVLEYQCFNEAYFNLYYTCLYQSFGLSSLSSDDYVFPDIDSYAGSPESYVAAHIDSLDIEGMAYERAETLLVYNESADRESYHADAERLAMVKENVPYINIDTLRNAAEHADKSLSAYIRFAIGNGVSESDVKNVLDLYARYNLFAEDKAESLQEAVSVEEAEKYREDNKSQFYYSEYVSCKLPNEDWVTEEVREKAAACKTFEELKDVLRAAETGDISADKESEGASEVFVSGSSLSDSVIVYPVDGSYSVKTEISTSVILSGPVLSTLIDPIGAFHRYIIRKNGGSVDDYETTRPVEGNTIIGNSGTITDSQETIKSYVFIDGNGSIGDTTITDNIGSIIGSSGNWSTVTTNDRELKVSEKHSVALPEEDDPNVDDLTRWLFAPDRRAGDVIVLKIDSSYHWIRIPEDATVDGYDSERTKVGYYVELKDDTATDPEEKTYTKDEKFALVLDAVNTDTRRDVFKHRLCAIEKIAITKDELKRIGDELADWFYSDERETGDYNRITVGEGENAKEYAVLFLGENEETWLGIARHGKAAEDMVKWYEEMKVVSGYTADCKKD